MLSWSFLGAGYQAQVLEQLVPKLKSFPGEPCASGTSRAVTQGDPLDRVGKCSPYLFNCWKSWPAVHQHVLRVVQLMLSLSLGRTHWVLLMLHAMHLLRSACGRGAAGGGAAAGHPRQLQGAARGGRRADWRAPH